MHDEPQHLSDEELLLVLDGESARSFTRKARAHLAACPACRARMDVLETTVADFVSHQQHSLAPEVSDGKGPSALLKARLADAAAAAPPTGILWRMEGLARTLAFAGAALLIAVLGARLLLKSSATQPAAGVVFAGPAVPDRNLTPGATRPVTLREVCSAPHEEVVRDVPGSLRQKVFQEYGINHPRPEDYEVDYLIAPGLGGTDDLRNLWPEPSTAPAWNAHRKDVLEERLHELVCDGQLDLDAAQRAIATDWIGAYEKYCLPRGVSGALPRRHPLWRQAAAGIPSKSSIPA